MGGVSRTCAPGAKITGTCQGWAKALPPHPLTAEVCQEADNFVHWATSPAMHAHATESGASWPFFKQDSSERSP